jgi:hypothetical protein
MIINQTNFNFFEILIINILIIIILICYFNLRALKLLINVIVSEKINNDLYQEQFNIL